MTCPRSFRISAVGLVFSLFLLPCGAHPAAEEMRAAATNFVATLTPDQKAKTVYEFKSDERFNWAFVPKSRQGLPLKEMTAPQRQLAHALLLSALSSQGYTKATNIISNLEIVLRELENQSARRDPGLYYLTIFGNPAQSPWGWRVEGHHLSMNFSIDGGQVLAVTPSFLGANPATVPSGPRQGLRTLPAEEDLGRQLLKSLNAEQRQAAVMEGTAPAEVITGSSRKAGPLEPRGVRAELLSPAQKDLLWSLIKEYVSRYQNDIAAVELKKIQDAGIGHISFAWAGGFEHGEKHYYRIQGPTFLMEYDNTQNDANHVHAVWRDFKNDFGEDLLRRHFEQVAH